MEKMSSESFSAGLDKFMKLLERQPNPLRPMASCAASGEELADMAVAFIDRIHKARIDRISSDKD